MLPSPRRLVELPPGGVRGACVLMDEGKSKVRACVIWIHLDHLFSGMFCQIPGSALTSKPPSTPGVAWFERAIRSAGCFMKSGKVFMSKDASATTRSTGVSKAISKPRRGHFESNPEFSPPILVLCFLSARLCARKAFGRTHDILLSTNADTTHDSETGRLS